MASDGRSGNTGSRRRPWIPEVIGDRYRVERELGSGAAAVTVAATDETLGRRVAVKVLKPESELDPEFSRRFSREARAAASVNHQNVVNVYDVGQDGDLFYLVMQLVDGTDLKRLVEREGPLPWRRAIGIARDVLSGLSAIHATGIVHRDIKPQNVLIGTDGSVKVTDFGVAHVELDSGLTTAGMTVGTATYMAPEQAQGNTPTPSADVYAVGVMLYEMVSGKVPFSAPTSVAVMLAHIQQQARPPVAPAGMEQLPDALVAVILQAMSKAPGSRFRSASAMRSALENPESWTASATSGSASQTGRTQLVPAASHRRSAPAGTRQSADASPSPRRTEAQARSGGGFGAFFVTMLLVLAMGLVATAGVLWYLEQQGDDGFPQPAGPPPTEVIQEAVDTPTLPAESEEPAAQEGPGDGLGEPGIIEPIEDEAPPPTDTPDPTEAVIVPPVETPSPTPASIAPSTELDEGVMIEPIEQSPTIAPGG